MKKIFFILIILVLANVTYESETNLNLIDLRFDIMSIVKNLWGDVCSWFTGLKKFIAEAWEQGGKDIAKQVCLDKIDKNESKDIYCNAFVKIFGLALDKIK